MSVLLFCLLLLAIPVAPQSQHAAICEVMVNNIDNLTALPGWNLSLCPPLYLAPFSDLLICTSGLSGLQCDGMNQVTSLTIAGTHFQGSFPSLIANLNQLTTLRILDASLLYAAPTTQFAALNNLQVLFINNLQVTGTFPAIGSLQLTTLHLLANDGTTSRLSGTIPSQPFSNLAMQYLNLRGQNFSGVIPQEILDTTTYTFLDLTDNSGLQAWSLPNAAFVNSPSLKRLYLENVNVVGSIPSSLTSLNLQDLFLGNNGLTGTIPSFACCSLENFKVNGNFLTGTIPTVLATGFKFFTFDVSSNALTGTLPDLQANSTVRTFDQYFKGNCYFNFESNQLTGSIPPAWPQFPDCTFIFADNLLNGSFPSNWSSLYIDGSRNQFTGTFPFIGPKVKYAFFSDNKFDSIVSPYSSTLLHRLDLSSNMLTSLPLMFLDQSAQSKFSFLSVVNFGYNQITGTFPGGSTGDMWLLNGNLAEIDLSYNYIVGKYNLNWRCSDSVYCLDPASPRIIRLIGNRLSSTKYLRETNAFEINHVVNPQDLDDCLAGTHQCAQNCTDGWLPVLSYTCACRTGYTLGKDGHSCSSICGDGYVTADEVCDPSVTPYGCDFNCTPLDGYSCNGTGCYGVCGDGYRTEDEPCDWSLQGTSGCDNTCHIVYGWSCLLDTGCIPCVQSGWTSNNSLNASQRHYLWLDQYPSLGWMDIYHCPTCSGSFLDQTRSVVNDFKCLDFPKVRQGAACAYSCTNLSADGLGDSRLLILKTELERGNMLYDILNTLYGIQTAIRFSSAKRDSQASGVLSFNFSGCNNSNFMQTAGILKNLTEEIFSGGTPLLDSISYTTNMTECTVDVTSDDAAPAPNPLGIGLGVGLGLAALLLLVLVLSYLYYRRRRAQHPAYLLPKQIQWSFVDYVENSSSWVFGGGDPGFYYKSLQRESSHWNRVMELFVENHGGRELEVTGIKMVFNKTILNSFINNWKITTSRILNTPQIFNKSVNERFGEEPDGNLAKRQYVERKYIEIVSQYPWNLKLTVPILSACHGTGEDVADKIAGTGFASLSALDDGYFGKGIYFTSFAMYTLPYFSLQRKPCIVLSYLVLGNMFPVIEDHKGPNSLLGKGLKGPSHYVVTNRNGRCVTEGELDVYDEIVLQQDSQAIPAFIITVDRQNFEHLIAKWTRELPNPTANYRSGSDEAEHKDTANVQLLI